MYNYHDVFFYYAFGTLNGGGGSIQVIGITEGTTSVTFESNGKPLITYRIYGSSSGVGDLNAETGKYDITVTCNEDTYTISLDAQLMDGEYIDYKTQRLYPSGLDVSMPEISTVSGTNTLTVITTNPSSKVYVECYRAKDIPLPVASTIIGSVPFEFQCYEAYHLMDYSISGNAVQESTPSPEDPVDAVGSGVRTGNLVRFFQEEMRGTYYGVDVTVKNAEITLNGTVTIGSGHWVEIGYKFGSGTESTDNVVIPCEPETPYTIATEILDGNSTQVRIIAFGTSNENRTVNIGSSSTTTFTGDINRIFISLGAGGVVFNNLKFRVMFNKGSTPLPYEPYGFKLPLTVNGTEYPIYLGEVPTTRRIKKLVLTGEESWFEYGAENPSRFITYAIADRRRHITPLCTHYIGSTVTNYSGLSNGYISVNTAPSNNNRPRTTIHDDRFLTVADFKSYLAAQYANGTPVTVWYVLAEPETAIVNEPLMKIGDYADTITFDQAGVNIPVIKGNNVLTINTDVPPSETYIKYNGKEKEYGYYITSDGYIYTTSDGYKYGIRS